MQNHGLGIHSVKFEHIVFTIKNTLKHLTTYSTDLPKRPKYLRYFKQKSHWVSVVRDLHNGAFLNSHILLPFHKKKNDNSWKDIL